MFPLGNPLSPAPLPVRERLPLGGGDCRVQLVFGTVGEGAGLAPRPSPLSLCRVLLLSDPAQLGRERQQSERGQQRDSQTLRLSLGLQLFNSCPGHGGGPRAAGRDTREAASGGCAPAHAKQSQHCHKQHKNNRYKSDTFPGLFFWPGFHTRLGSRGAG